MKFRLYTVATSLLLLSAVPISQGKIRALYNSLNPQSVAEQLAFYELFPQAQEGQAALQNAYRALCEQGGGQLNFTDLPSLRTTIDGVIALVNKGTDETIPVLSQQTLHTIEAMAERLPNRRLRGYSAQTEEEVLGLAAEEIDLARGLLLSELGSTSEAMVQIRSYEATLDLMALQILCQTSLQASPREKISAINRFIFGEMRFRYPAHSTYAKEIDLYTFLPAVLDSHKGVCLGVSLLYMCLAQRLNLPLELVTPPGHIYVRYNDGRTLINIETTARGIHVDSKEYLGIDTRSLQTRSVKEVIGMAHFNQASVFWEQQRYPDAIKTYRHALQYVPEDPLVKELLAYNLILNGEQEEGEQILRSLIDYLPDHAVSKDTVAEDLLDKKGNAQCLHAVFMRVNEKRESLLAKKDAITESLKEHPEFRAGWFALAVAWLQLQRESEALAALERYHGLNPNDATAEYYLAELYAERFDYNNAWSHLKNAERLTLARNHRPECLLELKKALAIIAPE